MPITLYESASRDTREDGKAETSIVTGIVINNCDLAMQGKVLVRIPSLNQEVWARVTGPGAGSGVGHFDVPRPDAEVLVALVHNNPVDAYILGGLWNTLDRPPITLPTDMQTKRVIRTGLTPATGHEVEFDDALQSIKITTSLTPLGQQSITLDPTGIEMKNLAGTIKITMDNTTQTITVQAAKSIELKALGQIKLQAANIDIQGTVLTKIAGGMVKIN